MSGDTIRKYMETCTKQDIRYDGNHIVVENDGVEAERYLIDPETFDYQRFESLIRKQCHNHEIYFEVVEGDEL